MAHTEAAGLQTVAAGDRTDSLCEPRVDDVLDAAERLIAQLDDPNVSKQFRAGTTRGKAVLRESQSLDSSGITTGHDPGRNSTGPALDFSWAYSQEQGRVHRSSARCSSNTPSMANDSAVSAAGECNPMPRPDTLSEADVRKVLAW